MKAQTNDLQPWERIFDPPEAKTSSAQVQMRLLRKGGRPFLLMPRSRRLSARALDLYAPQAIIARYMKWGLGLVSRFISPVGLEDCSIYLRPDDPFAVFLSQLSGITPPQFAMLAGNANAEGQRCVFLLFDAKGHPVTVVKAGAGTEATRLIAREEAFLKSAPLNVPGIPKLRSSFASERVCAFAIDFFPGASPPAKDQAPLKILDAWVYPAPVAISNLPIWQRLLEGAGASLASAARELGPKVVCSAIHHGDFAPWNIKVHRGTWTVLDWERGELSGLPLWDWLHFLVQPAILVEHAPPSEILARLAHLFRSPLFVEYANRARVTGLELPLTAAYLNYCIHVTCQTEGLEGIKALSHLLSQLNPARHGAWMKEFGRP